MINPFQAMQMLQNPQNLLKQQLQSRIEQMARQNPQVYQKVCEMTQGKTEEETKQICMNIANERGINLKQFASQFGINL